MRSFTSLAALAVAVALGPAVHAQSIDTSRDLNATGIGGDAIGSADAGTGEIGVDPDLDGIGTLDGEADQIGSGADDLGEIGIDGGPLGGTGALDGDIGSDPFEAGDLEPDPELGEVDTLGDDDEMLGSDEGLGGSGLGDEGL